MCRKEVQISYVFEAAGVTGVPIWNQEVYILVFKHKKAHAGEPGEVQYLRASAQ